MDILSVTLSILAIIIAVYYYIFKSKDIFVEHGIPCLPPKPIIGNMGSLILGRITFANFLRKLYDLHAEAKYVGLYEFSKPVIVVRDMDLIKSIGVKNFNAFPDHHPMVDRNSDPLAGNFLLSIEGDRWKFTRTMLTPLFTVNKLKSMFNMISTCAVDFAIHVSKLPEADRRMEFKSHVSKYTNDVIASCIYGVQLDSKRNPGNPFYVLGKQTDLAGKRTAMKQLLFRVAPSLSKALRLRLLSVDIWNFFRSLTISTMKMRDEGNIVRPDFIQQLMKKRKDPAKEDQGFSLEDICVHTCSFFFGGYESVSTVLCFVCQQLALNPDVLKKLQREIDGVIEATQGQVIYESVMTMEYLDAVINESMRMNPILSVIDRVCGTRFQLPSAVPEGKPFVIEPGTDVWIPLYPVHHDPRYFEDPERFDPERFMGSSRTNTAAFLPFGIGPRKCIGNRLASIMMKVMIFHLLARCEVKSCEETHSSVDSLQGYFIISPKEFWMKAEPRSDPHPLLRDPGIHGSE